MLWLIKNRGLDEPRRNNKLTELFGLVTNRERHILKGRRWRLEGQKLAFYARAYLIYNSSRQL